MMDNGQTTKPTVIGKRTTVMLLLVTSGLVCTLVSVRLRPGIIPSIQQLTELSSHGEDIQWVLQRQKLLSASQGPKKVLLVTYMRGGSTFLGELFKKNPHAVYWYEVAASFYADRFALPDVVPPLNISHYKDGSRRPVLAKEKTAVSHLFRQLFSCDFTSLPVATLVHNFLRAGRGTTRFMRCLDKSRHTLAAQRCFNENPLHGVCATEISNDCFTKLTMAKQCVKNSMSLEQCSADRNPALQPFLQHQQCFSSLKRTLHSCLPSLQLLCETSRVRSAKVVRLTAETLDTLIQQMPDIHVIYYTRDPRGIIASRITTGDPPQFFLRARNPIVEGELLCQKMLRDLTYIKSYERRFPGSILRLTYEDLAVHPMESLRKVYSYIGEDIPEFVTLYMKQATHAKTESSAFDTMRANSSVTALKWKGILSVQQQRSIYRACEDVYREVSAFSDEKASSFY